MVDYLLSKPGDFFSDIEFGTIYSERITLKRNFNAEVQIDVQSFGNYFLVSRNMDFGTHTFENFSLLLRETINGESHYKEIKLAFKNDKNPYELKKIVVLRRLKKIYNNAKIISQRSKFIVGKFPCSDLLIQTSKETIACIA
jgi:hypothetical protein